MHWFVSKAKIIFPLWKYLGGFTHSTVTVSQSQLMPGNMNFSFSFSIELQTFARETIVSFAKSLSFVLAFSVPTEIILICKEIVWYF